MDVDRIQAIVIANSVGQVIYERFFERYNEQEKAELRASIAEVAESSYSSPASGVESASRFRHDSVGADMARGHSAGG